MLDLRNQPPAHLPVFVGRKVSTAAKIPQDTYTLPRKKLQRTPSFESVRNSHLARSNNPASYKIYQAGPVRRAPPPPVTCGIHKPTRRAPDPPSHHEPNQQPQISLGQPSQTQQNDDDDIYEAPGATLPPDSSESHSTISVFIPPSPKAPPPPPSLPPSSKPPAPLLMIPTLSCFLPVLPLRPSLLIHRQQPASQEDAADKEEVYEIPDVPPSLIMSRSSLLATRELPPIPQTSVAAEQKENLEDVYECTELYQTSHPSDITPSVDKPPPVPDKPRPQWKHSPQPQDIIYKVDNQDVVSRFHSCPPPVSSLVDSSYGGEDIYEEADTNWSAREPSLLPVSPCLSPPSRPPPPPPLSQIPAPKPPAPLPARAIPPPVPRRTSSALMSAHVIESFSTEAEESIYCDTDSAAEATCSVTAKEDCCLAIRTLEPMAGVGNSLAGNKMAGEDDLYMEMTTPQNHQEIMQKEYSELTTTETTSKTKGSEELYTEMSPSPSLQYHLSMFSAPTQRIPPKVAPKPDRGLKPVSSPRTAFPSQLTWKKLEVPPSVPEQPPPPLPPPHHQQQQQQQQKEQLELYKPLEADDGDLYEPVGQGFT